MLAWSPDGERVAFGDTSTRRLRNWRTDGTEEDATRIEGQQPGFTPDGRFLIFVRVDDETQEDLWYVTLDGAPDPKPFLLTDAREIEPHVAPQGGWVAYTSDDTGRQNVYLRSFPDGSTVRRVSVDGGAFPRWSASGRRLYFLEDETRVVEVEIETEPTLRVSEPNPLFDATIHRLGPNHGWDVDGEGERFLTVELGDVAGGGDLTLVTRWDPRGGH
jgi:Tol biopolymer transport system component